MNKLIIFLVLFLCSQSLYPQWVQFQRVLAGDAMALDQFGSSVSISADGNTAIVGAWADDDNGPSSGSAYIFIRTGNTWSEQQKLLPGDGDTPDFFGRSVSISADGNTAIIGARRNGDDKIDSGSAYIFTRSGNTWTEQQKLTASDASDFDYFGNDVSISSSGNIAIVGSYFDDDDGGGSGSAYIFTRTGNTWAQYQKLTASDAAAEDAFGVKVGISGDGNTAIVAADGDDDGGDRSGSVYVFFRSGSLWSEQQKLIAGDAAAGDEFGSSLAISADGNTVIVGVSEDDHIEEGAGSAYVFTRLGSLWSEEQKLVASDAQERDGFGSSVSISSNGDIALIGSPFDNNAIRGISSGAFYLFVRSSGSWTEIQNLVSDDRQDRALFGNSVSLSADGTISIIGAPGETIGGGSYIFGLGGACCLPDGSCQISSESDCSSNLNGQYLGNGVVCPDLVTYYLDMDGDGYSDGTSITSACDPGNDYKLSEELTATSGDCDDNDININPGVEEVCDGIDNDCDGLTDDEDSDVVGQSFLYFVDADGDGFGYGPPISFCASIPPAGYVENNDDCNDNNSDITFIGDTCEDGNPDTVEDFINEDCECVGGYVIPAIGQWGVIILGLLTMIIGIIAVHKKKRLSV